MAGMVEQRLTHRHQRRNLPRPTTRGRGAAEDGFLDGLLFPLLRIDAKLRTEKRLLPRAGLTTLRLVGFMFAACGLGNGLSPNDMDDCLDPSLSTAVVPDEIVVATVLTDLGDEDGVVVDDARALLLRLLSDETGVEGNREKL
jgi:hypothetical protein